MPTVSQVPQLHTGRDRATTRRRLFVDSVLVALSVGAVAIGVKLVWPGFTYWGDNANSFMPLWRKYGEGLRSGESMLYDPQGWGGANVAAEAAYGIFNPITVLNALAMSLTDNLTLASYAVMVEFLAILGVGVYLLARVHGASRAASYIAGIMMPFAGFTLYYEAGNWASGLMATTWVVHFWWSARAYSTGRMGPLAAVVFGGLAVTVGNPYAVLGVLVVLFGLAVELAVHRRFRRLLGMVVAGACVGLIVLFVYLPLLHVLPQVDRPMGTTFSNNNYLTPSIGDIVALSSPSYLPRMDAWNYPFDIVPSTYLSWLVLPLLPWLRWGSVVEWKSRLGLISSTILFVLFTLGPSVVWLFRWPIRLVEYGYVGFAVLFAVVLSSGLAVSHLRRRIAITVVVLVSMFFVSWASAPWTASLHLLMTLIVACCVAAALFAYRRFAVRGIAAVTLLGTLIVTPIQASHFGWSFQWVSVDTNLSVPSDLQVVRDASRDFNGTVLQVADILELEGSSAVVNGQLNFGNTLAAAGIDTVNRYTGLHYSQFKEDLKIDFRGSIDQSFPLSRLFAPVAGFDASPLDALGVDTLVVSTTREDHARLPRLATGWVQVEDSDVRTVLVREETIGERTAFGSKGVQIGAVSAGDGGDMSFTYSSAKPGTALIDALAWAGHRAELGGEELPVSEGPYGLLEIELPQGSGTVSVTYDTPGLTAGLIALAVASLGALALQAFWWGSARRARETWAPEYADPSDVPSSYSI